MLFNELDLEIEHVLKLYQMFSGRPCVTKYAAGMLYGSTPVSIDWMI